MYCWQLVSFKCEVNIYYILCKKVVKGLKQKKCYTQCTIIIYCVDYILCSICNITNAYTHKQSHTHTRTHIRVRAHTHTHMYAHMYTHNIYTYHTWKILQGRKFCGCAQNSLFTGILLQRIRLRA